MLRRLLRFLSQLSEVVGGNFLLDDGDLRSHRVDDLALEQSVVDFAVFLLVSQNALRVKIRAPSFVSLCAMQELIPGHHISDVPIILGSMDFVLGECDR